MSQETSTTTSEPRKLRVANPAAKDGTGGKEKTEREKGSKIWVVLVLILSLIISLVFSMKARREGRVSEPPRPGEEVNERGVGNFGGDDFEY